MSTDDLEQRVLKILLDVAPDVEPATLQREVAFRDQFDFDSMDTLNFAIGLHQAFDIEAPETDYRRLASLASAADYVREALARSKPAP